MYTVVPPLLKLKTRQAEPGLRCLRLAFFSVLLLVLLLGMLRQSSITLSAQASETYIVQPGDTLAEIATRLGVDLDTLAAANNIADVNLIDVGQVLVIPGRQQTLSVAISHPGDTIEQIAARWNLSPTQLAALNSLDSATRLFPGQALYLPPTAQTNNNPRFGSVTALEYSSQVLQGRTGWLMAESSRLLDLTATWNNQNLPLAQETLSAGNVRYTAYLPVPALQPAGPLSLTLQYTARSGVPLSRTLPIVVRSGNYSSQEINLPPDRGALLEAELVQAELARVVEVWSKVDTPRLWNDVFVRPIDEAYATTSPYGTRRSYDGGPYDNYHAGQDFGAPPGITVTVPATGIVALAEPLTVRGNAVIIDHGQGVFTGYWHLSEMFVQTGQPVLPGDALGLVGNTGLSTGAHLHWELRIYGLAVDPMQFLEEARLFGP